ncbi:FecCD family ABC transporter permease [Brassicibacter mesophilus]|uniref:FecCD family ABC transporter permease n=1 Tax=Brassicibacter mesophilus TaxID=745119 RepID=UPI003D1A9122
MILKLSRKTKWNIIIIILFVVLFISVAFFATVGSANITVKDTIRIVMSKIPIINRFVDISDIPKTHQIIILNIRIPRVLLGVIVGAALSSVGTVFQGMFKNPMADPYVIGISSGAALGAGIVIITGARFESIPVSMITLGAFIGSVVTTFIVYLISRVKNKVPVTTLLLSGIAIGQFLTAILSFLMVIYTKDMQKIIYWTLGSFSGKGWDELLPIAIPILTLLIVLNFFSRDLNVLLLGEESAQNLGIEVEKVKIFMLLVCSTITAIAVSVSGIIGFVGLIIPHTVRLIVGPDHRILMPSAIFVGGIFMIFADSIARTIISPTEVPVGIITALFGGPFFIYLLRKSKNNI